MRRYDITLIFFNARLHNNFLNIINALTHKVSICVFVCPYHKFGRTPKTNRQFLTCCTELGAEVMEDREQIATEILFLPHVTALDEFYIETEIFEYISCKKRYALQAFGITGMHGKSGRALTRQGFRRKFIFDEGLDNLRNREDKEDYSLDEVFEYTEIGDLNIRYPVFDDFSCDYVVCFPTKLSMETRYGSYIFFRNVYELVKKIEANDTIALKNHTARDNESPLDSKLSRIFGNNRLYIHTLGGWAILWVYKLFGKQFQRNHVYREVMKGVFYRQICKRCRELYTMHRYANFGVELLLPGVKKGVVTGRSSVMWFALKQRIPVFNCDEEKEFVKNTNLNNFLQRYGVSSSGDQLTFDEALWETVNETEFDLIKFLKNELQVEEKI